MTRDLYFCGDIHGEFRKLVFQTGDVENSDIVVLGDFGIGFDNSFPEVYKRVEHRLEENNNTIYALRGNHDDPKYFINPENYPRMIFLEDHKEYILGDGVKTYIVGGATSIDAEWRIAENKKLESSGKCLCWWENEGIVKKYSGLPNKVDVILSHEAPLKFDPVFTRSDDMPEWIYKKVLEDRKYLDYVFDNTLTSYWYFGHYHKYISGSFNKTLYYGLDINELKRYNG